MLAIAESIPKRKTGHLGQKIVCQRSRKSPLCGLYELRSVVSEEAGCYPTEEVEEAPPRCRMMAIVEHSGSEICKDEAFCLSGLLSETTDSMHLAHLQPLPRQKKRVELQLLLMALRSQRQKL